MAALVVSNVVTNRHLPLQAHVPWSLGLTTGMLGIARWAGLGLADVGFDHRQLRGAVRAGAIGGAAIGAGYSALVWSGAADGLLRDGRVTNVSRREAAWHVLMRIPISTVVAEEIAFRGVLPALLTSDGRRRWFPAAVSSLLFGIWHVLPSLEGSRVNGATVRVSGRTAGLDVVATTLAGFALVGLRVRTKHLAAPMAIHLATNTLGFLATRWLSRRR